MNIKVCMKNLLSSLLYTIFKRFNSQLHGIRVSVERAFKNPESKIRIINRNDLLLYYIQFLNVLIVNFFS